MLIPLEVYKKFLPSEGRNRKWARCFCPVCNREFEINFYLLKSQKSCGCALKGCALMDFSGANNPMYTHGETGNREYRSWVGAIQRCHNPKNKNYLSWGGRGIYVCESWRNSFENFLKDMGRCPPNHSLDRINNDGPYSKENCRWATLSEQAKNRRVRERDEKGRFI